MKRALLLLAMLPTVARADTLVYVPSRPGYATVFTPSGEARYVPNAVVPQTHNGLTPVLNSQGVVGYLPSGLIPQRAGMTPVIVPSYGALPARTNAPAAYGSPASVVTQGVAGGSTGITIPMPRDARQRAIARMLCP
jgi:hypothetical protein